MSAAPASAKETSAHATDPEIWLARHGDYLYRFAMFRLRDRAAAEDVVQETLLAALQARARFASLSTERTWLVSILKHKLADRFRRMSREAALMTREDDAGGDDGEFFDQAGAWREGHRPSDWDADPAALLERKEFWEAIYKCLGALPARLASVFILREIDGLTGEEICEQLNIKPNNLWVMLHRARLQLRHALEQRLALHRQGVF